MTRTGAVAVRLLRAIRRDHRTLGLVLVVPVVLLWLITVALGGPDAVAVYVVDDDGSPFATQLTARLSALDHLVVNMAGDVASAREDALRDAAVAVVHIPPGASTRRTVDVYFDHADRAGETAARQALGPPLGTAGVTATFQPASLRMYTLEDRLAGPLLAVIVFFLTYLLTAISLLRERTEGTIERLFATPLTRTQFVLGYLLAFGLLALLQTAAILASAVYLLDVTIVGAASAVFLVLMLGAVVALGLGMLLSTFARNEFQVVQFIPVVIVPQGILGGIVVPVHALPDWLQPVAEVLPVTHMVRALDRVVLLGDGLFAVGREVGILLAFAAIALIATVAAVRRSASR